MPFFGDLEGGESHERQIAAAMRLSLGHCLWKAFSDPLCDVHN